MDKIKEIIENIVKKIKGDPGTPHQGIYQQPPYKRQGGIHVYGPLERVAETG